MYKRLVKRNQLALVVLASSFTLVGASVFSACGSSSDDVTSRPDGSSNPDGSTLDGGGGDGSTSTNDGGSPVDARGDGSTRCARTAAPADADRRVVVSHPFDKDGNDATGFELLTLSSAGVLTKNNVTFNMGTALESDIAVTPDGNVALVAQEDGTVGVVRFDGNVATVVHAAFKGTFYAGRVIMDPRGDRAYVLDEDTATNHGGVFAVDIACDGSLTDRGLVVPGGGANAMAFVPGTTQAVLSAIAAFDSGASADTDLVDLSDAGALVASGGAFPEGGAIVSDVAVTPDGLYALLADDGILVGNRVAVVTVPGLLPRGMLNVPNPAAVVASPFANAALILSSDGNDAIRLARYTPDASMPFMITSEITYVNGKPELPSFAQVVTRGALTGLVLVAENTAVRLVQFHDDGGATDVAKLDFGAATEDVVGVIGMQP